MLIDKIKAIIAANRDEDALAEALEQLVRRKQLSILRKAYDDFPGGGIAAVVVEDLIKETENKLK